MLEPTQPHQPDRVRGEGDERVDRGGIDQSVGADHVPGVGAVEDALDRQLELLAGQRARDRRHGDDRVRDVAGRERRPQRPGDPGPQLVVQLHPLA